MTHIEKRLADVKHKIATVKENHNNKYRCPKQIITTLTLIEMELEDYLFQLKAKTEFNF